MSGCCKHAKRIEDVKARGKWSTASQKRLWQNSRGLRGRGVRGKFGVRVRREAAATRVNIAIADAKTSWLISWKRSGAALGVNQHQCRVFGKEGKDEISDSWRKVSVKANGLMPSESLNRQIVSFLLPFYSCDLTFNFLRALTFGANLIPPPRLLLRAFISFCRIVRTLRIRSDKWTK
jgi:hypothetical protein